MEKEDKKRIYANYLEALVKRRLSIRRRRSLEIKRGGVHRDERLLELQNEWDRIDVLWKKAVETGNTPGTSSIVNETESNDAQLGGAGGIEDESAGSSASVGTSQRGGASGDERATTSQDVFVSNVAHNSGGEDERATTSHDADERPEIITYIQNFRGRHTVRKYSVPSTYNRELRMYLHAYRDYFIDQMRDMYDRSPLAMSLRIHPIIVIRTLRQNISGDDQNGQFVINLAFELVSEEEISEVFDRWVGTILERYDTELQDQEGSLWIIDQIESFSIEYVKVEFRVQVGLYVAYPKKLRGSQYVFNPEINDGLCVLRAFAAYQCHKKNMSWKNIRRAVNTKKGCLNHAKSSIDDFPITRDKLGILEKENKVSLYVYQLRKDQGGTFMAMCRKGNKKYKDIMCALLLNESHLVLIKDFDGYVRTIMSEKGVKKRCRSCLMKLNTQEELDIHEDGCKVNQILVFPPERTTVHFKNFSHSHSSEYIGVFDFECALDTTLPAGKIESRHKAIAYCYIIFDRTGEIVCMKSYKGEDAVNHFILSVSGEWTKIKFRRAYHVIHMTEEDKMRHDSQVTCELCGNTFKNAQDKRKHHDHTLKFNNYIGTYCGHCNLQCKDKSEKLLLFCHNMSYDLGIILKELQVDKYEIELHSKQGLRFLKVDIGKVRFQDSLSLLNGSLSTLADQHIKAGKSLKYTEAILKDAPQDVLPLLCKGKQVLCYDYIDSLKKLDETKLPSKEHFFNSLRNSAISQEDYDHALKVFDLGKCKTLGDYLMLYLKTDVGLLADVFMEWRKTLKDIYKLDVSNYISLPSFSWDAFLLKTNVKLDMIYSHELYDLIKRNLRGGFTCAINQYTKADNPLINPNFVVESGMGTHILYLYFNSLYASAMVEALPQNGIRKLSNEEKVAFLDVGLSNVSCEGQKGYWIECDTKYVTPEVARRTDDLPLILSHMNISQEMLSPYCESILKNEGRKIPKSNAKLVGSHLPQKNYLISLDLLQLLLELGLEVEKVHTIYEYTQSKFLEPFITTNIAQRTATRCPIKSKAFKLTNNAIFGKSLLNITKYAEYYRYIKNEKAFVRASKDPFLKNITHLNQDRVICTFNKEKLEVKQPLYLGFQILEIAKKKLYHFWYKVLKQHYGDDVRLLYTDTDSYIFSLKCKDLYTELKSEPLLGYMDFSNFSPDHPLYDDSRKGEVGLLKSEMCDNHISELIALKAKMYSVKIAGRSTTVSRANGIPLHFMPLLTHARYKNVLTTVDRELFTCKSISNVKGEICTVRINKRGISAFDDKRYHLDTNQSLAYGHPDIPLSKRSRIE
ncbi:uncharacterized protein [Cherax quadricarinatus]|uniref:uncharacterized protein n=1 Tax=Cherax quadricarinatus TaxID=27406 RepID=UPI00387E23E5